MKQFATIEKLDTGILYVLELTASLSVLLLAFGLIASLVIHPEAKVRDVATALTISTSTANKWMTRIRGERSDDERGE